MVGVSSPRSMVNSEGSTAKRFTRSNWAERLVQTVENVLVEALHLGALGQLLESKRRKADALGPGSKAREVGHDQRRGELALLADDHRLGYQRVGLELVLERLRRDRKSVV